MQSFHFCCYGDEYLLSRIASAVSSPGVVQRNQSVSCHTVSLTPHWVVCLYFQLQKLYITYLVITVLIQYYCIYNTIYYNF